MKLIGFSHDGASIRPAAIVPTSVVHASDLAHGNSAHAMCAIMGIPVISPHNAAAKLQKYHPDQRSIALMDLAPIVTMIMSAG